MPAGLSPGPADTAPKAPRRECAYCPTPTADCCVRTQSSEANSSRHVYAHKACAARAGVTPLYEFTDDQEASR
ncbi:hypothetical protein ACIRQY_01665 [Streptomyces sp. NPDC101490]|uniref:hypothetical protein n=1 Tax=Streptomyces sp. NPDC101490 TaxID=3366143 RepID=UPI003802D236